MRPLQDRLDLCAINTATLGYQCAIEHTVEAVARAGFGAIAPWRRELEDRDASRIGRLIRDAGLKVSGYCRSTYIPAATHAEFLANLADNRRALDQAAALQAGCFVMVVGGLPAGTRNLPDARRQLREGVALLLEHARAVGVPLALEPLHPMYAADRSCLNTLQQALDLCDALEPPAAGGPRHLGVALDVYHCWWDPALEAQIVRAGAANRLLAFHVCDWLVPTRDMLLDRGMMGDGIIDIAGIRRQVEAAGYDGAVEVEIFSSDDWWTRPVDHTLSVCGERLQSVC